jgi:ABC-2 type transport system ATP-binding protein
VQGTTIMVTTHFMDEAEHCDEIGFIYEGKLIANAAPDHLKKGIPGVLLEIAAEEPMEKMEKIAASGIPHLDIYPYGTSVHVLILPEQQAAFAQMQFKIIQPTLEDVFVYYVKEQRKELMV